MSATLTSFRLGITVPVGAKGVRVAAGVPGYRPMSARAAAMEAGSLGDLAKLASEEHSTMGRSPPSGSLVSHRNSTIDPAGDGVHRHSSFGLLRAVDASDVASRGITKRDGSRLMSEEHETLGYHPLPSSLGSQAQSAASRLGDESPGRLPAEALTCAAKAKSASIDPADFGEYAVIAENPSQTRSVPTAQVAALRIESSAATSEFPFPSNFTKGDTHELQSEPEEQKALSYRPPTGPAVTEALHVTDRSEERYTRNKTLKQTA